MPDGSAPIEAPQFKNSQEQPIPLRKEKTRSPFSIKSLVEKINHFKERKNKQKQTAWDTKKQEIGSIVDRLGRGIDEGIKDTVVAFQMNGINTTNSCEGHTDHGLASPFIEVGDPNRPAQQFNREEEIFKSIAAAYHMSVMDMRRSETDEARQAWRQAYIQSEESGETPAFVAWKERSARLGQKADRLLKEFYTSRHVAPERKLHIEQTDDGIWTIMAGDFEEAALSPQEKGELLIPRREEMQAFTDFLKRKYFS